MLDHPFTGSAPRTLSLLVDEASLRNDPQLAYLLTFTGVDGITVEKHVQIVERPGQGSFAIVGPARNQCVGLAPLNQFKEIARKMAARPDCSCAAPVIERALAFAHLGGLLRADAVVSPAGPAFTPSDQGLIRDVVLVTVSEALALIGGYARLRERVPLGGRPLLVQDRTVVYPLTASAIIPASTAWRSYCLTSGVDREELEGYCSTVIRRVGQALRGRDGVHEALRMGKGRGAVLDALYHLDVVLTSSVGGLDALARAADLFFGIRARKRTIGWQNRKKGGWMEQLRDCAPAVTALTDSGTELGAKLRILLATRNTIHSVPVDEYLHAQIGTGHRIEHRAMMTEELAGQLREHESVLEPLDRYGVFLGPSGTSSLDVGLFAEALLSWTIELCDAHMRSLTGSHLSATTQLRPTSEIEEFQRECCVALAQVGNYPCRVAVRNLQASPSLQQKIMRAVYRARQGWQPDKAEG